MVKFFGCVVVVLILFVFVVVCVVAVFIMMVVAVVLAIVFTIVTIIIIIITNVTIIQERSPGSKSSGWYKQSENPKWPYSLQKIQTLYFAPLPLPLLPNMLLNCWMSPDQTHRPKSPQKRLNLCNALGSSILTLVIQNKKHCSIRYFWC